MLGGMQMNEEDGWSMRSGATFFILSLAVVWICPQFELMDFRG
jgi:hypothetical protein